MDWYKIDAILGSCIFFADNVAVHKFFFFFQHLFHKITRSSKSEWRMSWSNAILSKGEDELSFASFINFVSFHLLHINCRHESVLEFLCGTDRHCWRLSKATKIFWTTLLDLIVKGPQAQNKNKTKKLEKCSSSSDSWRASDTEAAECGGGV